MKILASIRVGVAAVGVAAAAAGQGLPASAPTNPGLQAAPSQPQSKQAAQPAQVQLHGGMLTVAADNSSLNQILRDISRVTGMKITGGVTDERVYGSYGPADVSTVLSSLIRGTGSNMMIVMDANQAPQELVLTPRAGGPTPPNPNAGREREMEDLPPQRQQHFQRPDGVGNPVPNQFQQQQPQQPQAQVVPPVPPPVVPSSSDTTTQESPNGVKTPQQIYDQLMKMQQQQQQQQQKPPQ
jgi:hypothetical protein